MTVDTNDIFGRIANRYDTFNLVSSLGMCRHWLNVLVSDVVRYAPMKILDVAAGTGEVGFAIANILPWAHITLSDLSPEMLAVAEKRVCCAKSNMQPDNINLVVADAQKLPFASNSYDAITCAYGIRNVSNREMALEEFFRVLKPSGRLYIMEFSTPPALNWRKLYHLYLRLVVPTVGSLLTGDRGEFCYLRESILAFPNQTSFCEMLYSVGFSDIRYRNLTGGIVSVFSALKTT